MWTTTTEGIRTLVVDPSDPTRSGFPEWSPEKALAELAVEEGAPLIVDLQGVAQARSDFIGYLARLKQILNEQESPMVVVLTNPELKRTFDVLSLHRVFILVSSVDEAVAWCRKDGRSHG